MTRDPFPVISRYVAEGRAHTHKGHGPARLRTQSGRDPFVPVGRAGSILARPYLSSLPFARAPSDIPSHRMVRCP